MSIASTAEFFIHPERSEEFLGMLSQSLPTTRGYDGCELVETYVDQDDPGHIFLFERWSTREQYQAYLDWRMANGMLERLEPIGTAPPRFTFLEPRPEV